MVKLILGTDMAKHKELIDELQKHVSNFDHKNTIHMEAVSFLLVFFSVLIKILIFFLFS